MVVSALRQAIPPGNPKGPTALYNYLIEHIEKCERGEDGWTGPFMVPVPDDGGGPPSDN
jgi:hypothetical protein